MRAKKTCPTPLLATLLLLVLGSIKPAAMADRHSSVHQLMGAPATLFDLGIWRLELLMTAVAKAQGSGGRLPMKEAQSLRGQAEYDPERNEIVLRLRAIGSKPPPLSVNECREAWYRVREQLFWQEGIPFRARTLKQDAATLLQRQFSHYAVEPNITPRDLQQDLLTVTRLAITSEGPDNAFLECSAPLVGGEFRIVDEPR